MRYYNILIGGAAFDLFREVHAEMKRNGEIRKVDANKLLGTSNCGLC